MVYIEKSYIYTDPDKKSYFVSSNYVNYLELGYRMKDYYLEASVIDDKYILTVRLYDENGDFMCYVVDNELVSGEGCEIVFDEDNLIKIEKNGDVILELLNIGQNVCIIVSYIYDDAGNIIARGTPENFYIYKGPAIIGKKENNYGIIINPSE